ncbi:pyridoxamine 5'-phosphate oxidase family protein [Dactylosporangium sp. AC04546]|uniref:pyridoxamine 5'-phosphate oxidase family protein n=1 Tax=Dactylosporangium sp. AC04546 TaxID=2862460 RepID=UPI001EE08CE9|nr:pyridoxamine 5'-phosphate oxidase family protein [Dactylosporangium sp. AC04546]WVK78784.1 pyridoxamine 5'-phosphate oxidase family protein [Dactylosporangium sp. AC04546]
MAQLTETERAYLRGRRLSRMATVDPHGQSQVNSVVYFLQDDDIILIGGLTMGTTKN